MQLDHIAIALRRRNAWQAIDLGFAVARSWWLPLWLGWTLPALLLFLPFALLLPADRQWLALMPLWWFKPLWDAVPLYIASRRLFGESVTLREAWRQAPRLLGRELLAWLTWRRLSTTRSADLPVSLLERLRGEPRRRRLRQLHAGMGSAASWLTFACLHFEMILTLGVVALFALMLPEQADFDAQDFLAQGEAWQAHVYNLIVLLAVSAVAPVYTMAGFMLYICRRVELEGWDIEIRFRNLAARRQADEARGATGPGAARTLCALLLAGTLCGMVPAAPAHAADAPVAPPTAATEKARISEILDGPDFHQRVERRTLKPRQPAADDEDGEAPDWLTRLLRWLSERFERSDGHGASDGVGLAAVLEFLLWLLAGALLLYVLPRLLRRLGTLPAAPGAAPPPAPEVLFGLDVRPQSLPADVAGTVRALWQSGDPRAALGLLYRATLARLMAEQRMPFADHHTEGECAQLVGRLAPELDGFFGELTRVWQTLAYAHRPPGEHEFAGLCRQWQERFGRAQ